MLHVIPTGNLSQGLGIAYPSSPTTFSYTGADQTYTVPAGVTRIRVKCWGGGGMHYFGSGAFGGGFSYGEIAVTPGQTIKVMVGSGGRQSTSVLGAQYGGGGAGGTASTTKITGAGLSGVFDSTITFANSLLIAGGAGGNGWAASATGSYGGGSSGAAGDRTGGGGGTQVAGGAAGDANATAGSQLTGGAGSTVGSVIGGGGGGYYGGGGSADDGGGGGGSGYIGGCVTDGSESLTATTTAATDITSAGSGDNDYTAGVGLGKSSSTRPDNAGNGEVYIY